MLSIMETNPHVELAEADRLAHKARIAATDYPTSASLVLIAADVVLIGVFVAVGLSAWMIVGWLAFLAIFHTVLRLRRHARPRAPWATPTSRRQLLKTIALDVAVNAVWIPLFFLARPVAIGLLLAALAWSLVGTLKYRHA
ncbi:MAG: hypothetical protein QOG90_734 [Actinomycetota bacterium]|jgi:hypothetical protein